MNSDYYFDNNCLPKELAEEIYTLLVEKLQAKESWREDCINYLTEPSQFSKEYRLFGNLLGWGGKIYWDGWSCRVNFYPEDYTEERGRLRTEVNTELKNILAKYGLNYDL